MRGPLNRIFATTGSLATQAKIARRYLYAFLRHGTPRKYWNFLNVEWARWRGNAFVRGMPYVLKIESTNICNLECPFCLDRDRSQFKAEGMRGFGRMRADFFKAIIDQLGPYAFNVNLYGSGEPLLFPEAYEMMRYAADRNIGVRISSNLSMRDFDDELAARIVGAGIEHLIISCHGASQETYEKYQVGGDFERVLRNMKKLVETRRRLKRRLPFLDWQFLIFRHNQHELERARALAREIGVDLLRLIYPNIPPEHKEAWRPRAEGEAAGYQAQGEAGKAARKEGAPAQDARPESRAVIRVERCSWPYRSIYFNWDGGILPCCDGTTTPAYDLAKFDATLDVRAIWNGPHYAKIRRYANFEVAPADMEKRYTCASCLKPLAPFLVLEKGMLLDPQVEKKIKQTLGRTRGAG